MKIIKKYVFIIAGFISLFFAMIGIVAKFIPFIPFPTTPFLLLASFCFTKGSDKFDRWFRGTKIYKKYLEDYMTTHSMTKKQKRRILTLASTMLIISFILVPFVWARVILAIAFVSKYLYFYLFIKTIEISTEESKLVGTHK